jgi:hypothetical protein
MSSSQPSLNPSNIINSNATNSPTAIPNHKAPGGNNYTREIEIGAGAGTGLLALAGGGYAIKRYMGARRSPGQVNGAGVIRNRTQGIELSDVNAYAPVPTSDESGESKSRQEEQRLILGLQTQVLELEKQVRETQEQALNAELVNVVVFNDLAAQIEAYDETQIISELQETRDALTFSERRLASEKKARATAEEGAKAYEDALVQGQSQTTSRSVQNPLALVRLETALAAEKQAREQVERSLASELQEKQNALASLEAELTAEKDAREQAERRVEEEKQARLEIEGKVNEEKQVREQVEIRLVLLEEKQKALANLEAELTAEKDARAQVEGNLILEKDTLASVRAELDTEKQARLGIEGKADEEKQAREQAERRLILELQEKQNALASLEAELTAEKDARLQAERRVGESERKLSREEKKISRAKKDLTSVSDLDTPTPNDGANDEDAAGQVEETKDFDNNSSTWSTNSGTHMEYRVIKKEEVKEEDSKQQLEVLNSNNALQTSEAFIPFVPKNQTLLQSSLPHGTTTTGDLKISSNDNNPPRTGSAAPLPSSTVVNRSAHQMKGGRGETKNKNGSGRSGRG